MGGDNNKELPTFKADTHLGPSGPFIIPKWILKWISGHSTFWVMSQDVYSKAEPEEEAAACLILCKACFVNGLGEYFKKSLTKWIL